MSFRVLNVEQMRQILFSGSRNITLSNTGLTDLMVANVLPKPLAHHDKLIFNYDERRIDELMTLSFTGLNIESAEIAQRSTTQIHP